MSVDVAARTTPLERVPLDPGTLNLPSTNVESIHPLAAPVISSRDFIGRVSR